MTTGDLWPEPLDQSRSAAHQPELPGIPAGLREEWIGFYGADYHRVVRFLMHSGASLNAAQDAAQEAFAESWKLVMKDSAAWLAISNKPAWIRTTAIRRHLRPPGPRRRPLTDGDGTVPDKPDTRPDHAELTAQTDAVLQALRSLDDESCAVMAFSLDGFPTAEIAEALNISEQRVRDVKRKARKKLKLEIPAAEGRKP